MPGTSAGTDFVTSDLSLAAYLAERGLDLRMADTHRSGDFRFVLDDRSGQAQRLSVNWSNSCCRKHEARLRSLKSLVFSGRNGRRNGR